jgi:hypothetical protein
MPQLMRCLDEEMPSEAEQFRPVFRMPHGPSVVTVLPGLPGCEGRCTHLEGRSTVGEPPSLLGWIRVFSHVP